MDIKLQETMDPHSRSIYIDGLFYGNLLFHENAKPRFSFAAGGFQSLDIEVMQTIIGAFNKLQKPYIVKVLWNTDGNVEIAKDDEEGNQHYEFATKEEAKAFISGIEESSFSIHDEHTARLFNRLGDEIN